MHLHSNQLSWAIKHPFISLTLKYHSPGFICFSTMLAPSISSLDEIYCMQFLNGRTNHMFVNYENFSMLTSQTSLPPNQPTGLKAKYVHNFGFFNRFGRNLVCSLKMEVLNLWTVRLIASIPLEMKIFHLYLRFTFKEMRNHTKNYHLRP